ncbi:hypothetical protein ACF0H5_017391 [Mactra antiquata]
MDMKMVCLVFVSIWMGMSEANMTESDLHRRLFKDYLPDVKPHLDKETPLEVTLNMYLMSIDNINEKRQTITVRGFMELTWTDDFLVWDKDLYSNISVITVKDDSIWRPNVALMDTFGKPTDLGYGGQVIVESDGLVTVWPYKMYTVSCKINIANFPFDKQTCKFDFASWSSNNKVIALKNLHDKIPTDYLIESGEWETLDTRVHSSPKSFGKEKYDHIIFTIELKRKSLFHVMNLMIPVLCISLLNVTSFLLPSEDGERVTLSISVFLTLAVFLTVVNSSMPETSDEVATFTIYVGLQLFGSAMTVVLTVVSLGVFHIDEEHKVPKQLKCFVKMCCVRKKKIDQVEQPAPGTNTTTANGTTPSMKDIFTYRIKMANEQHRVTWKMVSRAMDKFCAIVAVIWHVLLFASMLTSMTQK